jgi:hypothetical protein
MDPIALSIEDTRKALGGIGRTKLYDLIGKQSLRTFKVGTRTLVTTESIRAFVASQTGA